MSATIGGPPRKRDDTSQGTYPLNKISDDVLYTLKMGMILCNILAQTSLKDTQAHKRLQQVYSYFHVYF